MARRCFQHSINAPGVLLENHKADYGSAEQHYRRAIAIDPEYADAHYNLGVLLDHKEDYDGAEQHYRRAIAIDPEYADAHCNLDILLEQRKADCRHSAAGQPRPSWCL